MGADGGLRHVVHRRVHLERHQPKARKRLGYLEKHKDYVKRADDFHRKENALKKMHRKAYFKNEDEFHFGMLSHKVKDGRALKKEKKLGPEAEKLLDTQDARYVGMREAIDRKAVERKSERLQFLNAEKPNKHTIFLDEEAAGDGGANSASSSTVGKAAPQRKRKLKDVDVAAYFETHPSLLGRKANRLRLGQLEDKALVGDQGELAEATASSYKELLHRQERAKKLRYVREELEIRQQLRQKGRKFKVADRGEDGRPAVYRWVPDRKR